MLKHIENLQKKLASKDYMVAAEKDGLEKQNHLDLNKRFY